MGYFLNCVTAEGSRRSELKKRKAAMQRLKAFQTSIRNVEAPQSKQTLKTIQGEKAHPSDIRGNPRPQDGRAIAQMGAGGKALIAAPSQQRYRMWPRALIRPSGTLLPLRYARGRRLKSDAPNSMTIAFSPFAPLQMGEGGRRPDEGSLPTTRDSFT
jgi:hypothetical protein